MALDARHRSSIYGKFAEILGEDDANALMTEFPSIEADELVTKQFLRAELAEFRAEFRAGLTELRSDLRTELFALRSELTGEIAGLRSEMTGEIAGLRSEMTGEIAEGRRDTLSLRAEMADRFRRQTIWTASGFAATNAITLTALSILV